MAASSRHNFEFSSWYNTEWTRKWLVPWVFYDINEFLDNQNLGIDTKIGFISGMVPKLLDI